MLERLTAGQRDNKYVINRLGAQARKQALETTCFSPPELGVGFFIYGEEEKEQKKQREQKRNV